MISLEVGDILELKTDDVNWPRIICVTSLKRVPHGIMSVDIMVLQPAINGLYTVGHQMVRGRPDVVDRLYRHIASEEP